MTKSKLRKHKIEFDFDNNFIENLDEIAATPLNEGIRIVKAGENQFTLGRSLGFHEHEGKGIPEANDNVQGTRDLRLSIDIRFAQDSNGDLELQLAMDNTTTHFKFPLTGLDRGKTVEATMDFERRAHGFLRDAVYYLAWACYRGQDGNPDKRKEAYGKIMSNIEIQFKSLLLWKRYKDIETTVKRGVTITKSVPIEQGTNPQTPEEIEKEKNAFISDIQRILNDRMTSGLGAPTRKNVALELFPANLDKASAMKRALHKYNLKYTELVKGAHNRT